MLEFIRKNYIFNLDYNVLTQIDDDNLSRISDKIESLMDDAIEKVEEDIKNFLRSKNSPLGNCSALFFPILKKLPTGPISPTMPTVL